jgi:hypothetical protein
MKRLALKMVACLAVSTVWIAALPLNHYPATSTKSACSAKSAASAACRAGSRFTELSDNVVDGCSIWGRHLVTSLTPTQIGAVRRRPIPLPRAG